MVEQTRTLPAPVVWAWRHPRAEGADGRCIGITDLRVDARRAKRLARRIQAAARRYALPQVVYTSPLQRGAAVGRWLRRWGWVHVIDSALLEMDFGAWDGQRWADIPKAEVDAWCAAFTCTAPGGGETLAGVLNRAARWQPSGAGQRPALMVAHAGWMLARLWRHEQEDRLPGAADWPVPPAHGVCWLLPGVPFAASDRPSRCLPGEGLTSSGVSDGSARRLI
ncbi:MAG: histidine phosphatase family protein [Burkholderiaceae bacterium]